MGGWGAPSASRDALAPNSIRLSPYHDIMALNFGLFTCQLVELQFQADVPVREESERDRDGDRDFFEQQTCRVELEEEKNPV